MLKYSVVATTFNDEKEILSYLINICEQSYLPYEIVIADGGSKDETLPIIENYSCSSPIPIRIVTKGRLNIAEGYNEAIKVAKSEFVGITGVGNYYEPLYFEKLIDVQETENYDIVYSPIRGRVTTNFSRKYCETFLNGEKGQVLPIASNHGALIKKDVFFEAGFFYTRFVYAGEDAEFYERTRQMGFSQIIVEDAVVKWFIPESFDDYIKQVRNYTIANMQLWSNLRLLKYVIKRLFPIMAFIILVFLGVFFNWIAGVIGCFLLLLMEILFLKSKKGNLYIRFASMYLPIFYIMTNLKYTSSKFKIHRINSNLL